MPKVKQPRQLTTRATHEIDEEVEAKGDGGEVPEQVVRDLGAVNAEAVQENERRSAVLGAKRAHTKNVPWGEENACAMYDLLIQMYPAHTLQIQVERITGTPASWYLYTQPRDGAELYQSIQQQCHRRAEETTYKIRCNDKASHQRRGVGRLTLPSTLEEVVAPPGSPHYVPPAPYAPQPQPAHQPWGPHLLPQNQPQQQQPQGVPQDQLAYALQLQRQLSEMQAQSQAMALQIQRLTSGQLPAPAAAPVVGGAPPQGAPPPPQGATVWAQGLGWVTVGTPPAQQAPPPPPKPLTPVEQWRTAYGQVAEVATLAREIQKLGPVGAAPVAKEDDPTTYMTTQIGEMQIVSNKEDGALRLVETAIANGPKLMEWVEKQQTTFRDAQIRAQQQQAAAATGTAPPPAQTNGAASSGGSSRMMDPPKIPGVG